MLNLRKIRMQAKKSDAPEVNYTGFKGFVYGLLPLLPIVLLLIVFFMNIVAGTKLNLSVQVVSIISFVVAVVVELLYKSNFTGVLKETSHFFNGMGNVMSIVALLVSAQVFVQGLTSIGILIWSKIQ